MTLLPQPAGDNRPMRCCLLSGGASRRMGRDKALLPHPEGGTWLERCLELLAQLEQPITLLSRHPAHLEQAAGRPLVSPIAEPAPWEGPLLALHRLMLLHPDQRLLLCPVDMPALTLPVLRQLRDAAAMQPSLIHLAHDGTQRQPLLGIYPSHAAVRLPLARALAGGERRLQGWLAWQPCRDVHLDAGTLRNVNLQAELATVRIAPPPDP